MDSILNSIKKMLGITEDYKHFDADLILLINSEFDTLHQLGVGPETKFSIEDETSKWDEFLVNDVEVNEVREFIALRVRLMFDPPANSFVVQAMEKKIDELVWRMNVDVETNWEG